MHIFVEDVVALVDCTFTNTIKWLGAKGDMYLKRIKEGVSMASIPLGGEDGKAQKD